MLAAYVETPNQADPLSVLTIGERPERPVPKGWIRVKMTHASLNRHDIFTLMGKSAHPEPIEFPITLGCDGAGKLEDGSKVAIYPVMGAADWTGDETLDPAFHIFHEKIDGTFADYTIMPRRNAVPLPAGLRLEHAAVLGTAWLTAYRLLFTKLGIAAGQTILVQGASGGVSTASIQLARAAGLEVWVTSRSPEAGALAERLGARCVFGAGQRLPRQVDVVVDNVGAATWPHSLQSVSKGGAIGTIGATTGPNPPADLSSLFVRQIKLVGSKMGTLDEMKALMQFVAAAGIAPEIGHCMPLEQARDGIAAMIDGRVNGKVVFTRP